MRARILALVAAVAMVVGAIVVRDRIDHPSTKRSSGSGGSVPAVACAEELKNVCEVALTAGHYDLSVEPAAKTLAQPSAVDAWMTPGPFTAIADAANSSQEPMFRRQTTVLARSPLVLVVWGDKAGPLRDGCKGTIGWKCVGDAVNGGGFRLAAPAANGAISLLADSGFAAGYLGRSDYATNDLDDPGVTGWLLQLSRAIDAKRRNGVRSVSDMLITGHAVVDGFVTTEAEAEAVLSSAAQKRDLEVVCLSPLVVASVTVGSRPTQKGDKAKSALSGQLPVLRLQTERWITTLPSQAPSRCGPLGKDDGLPSPGVLDALEGLVTS